MNEENSKPDSSIKSTIEAATGLVKAIPVYQDAIQPSAQQIGKSLETITKTVNIALAPIKALVWGYEQIENFITSKVSEKLKNVPPENIRTPLPQIAGPSVEALRYVGHDDSLRELFANLLATAMDVTNLHKAHPGYVDIIKNISSDEAELLKVFIDKEVYPIVHVYVSLKENSNGRTLLIANFSLLHEIAKISRRDLLSSYLDNLCRLGIIEIPQDVYLTAENIYDDLETNDYWTEVKKITEERGQKLEFDKAFVRLTSYGKNFVENVVKDKT